MESAHREDEIRGAFFPKESDIHAMRIVHAAISDHYSTLLERCEKLY